MELVNTMNTFELLNVHCKYWTVKRSCSDVQIKGVTIAAAGWTDFEGQEFLEDTR